MMLTTEFWKASYLKQWAARFTSQLHCCVIHTVSGLHLVLLFVEKNVNSNHIGRSVYHLRVRPPGGDIQLLPHQLQAEAGAGGQGTAGPQPPEVRGGHRREGGGDPGQHRSRGRHRALLMVTQLEPLKNLQKDFTITEKAPTRAFPWLKTFKTWHYAKLA